MTGDRWVRQEVLQVGPGHWKKQLPTKHLKLAERGDRERLEALLDESPELLNRRGSHGRTFLFEAVRKGREQLVGWLIDQGANIHLTGCYNIETIVQINPLSAARWYRRTGLVEMLISRGASNDIFRSAFNGEREAVENGLNKDIEFLTLEDPEDEIYYTPLLSFAIAGGHLELAHRLVQLGAEVPAYSFQLLFISALRDREDLVRMLLEHGATPLSADARLWMATNDLGILRLLANNGLSANQRSYRGLHPLAYAARGDKGSHPEKVELLLECGAAVNDVGPHKRTALHYAANAGFDEVVSTLLHAGADSGLVDDECRSPRDLALSKGHSSTANLLA